MMFDYFLRTRILSENNTKNIWKPQTPQSMIKDPIGSTPQPYLCVAQPPDGAGRAARQAQLVVYPELLVGSDQLAGRPDLDRFDLMRRLRLDPIGGQHLLEAHALRDERHLDDEVGRRALRDTQGGQLVTVRRQSEAISTT